MNTQERNMSRMTAEQQEMAAKNMPFAKFAVKKYLQSEIDEDWISESYVALCTAAMTYDPEKKIAFSTYAATVIRNHLIKQEKHLSRKKRNPESPMISLDAPIPPNEKSNHSYDGDDMSLIGNIPDKNIDIENDVIGSIICEQAMKRTPLLKRIYETGISQKELAIEMHMSKSAISLRVNKERGLLQQMLKNA